MRLRDARRLTRETLSAALRFPLQRFFAFPSTARAIGADGLHFLELVGMEKESIIRAVAVDRKGNQSPLVAGSPHAMP